jgi:hypothetical protein
MFASIVFVLPTHLKGGNLILRSHNRELNFDAPSVLQSSSSPPGSVAWVALYNDVEYEILEVIEGACIMITFHLYSDPSRAAPKPPTQSLPQSPTNEMKSLENSFTLALREMFRDAAFIRKHKYLGFGFECNYRWRRYFHLPFFCQGTRCVSVPDSPGGWTSVQYIPPVSEWCVRPVRVLGDVIK